jgi:hypothetical protein
VTGKRCGHSVRGRLSRVLNGICVEERRDEAEGAIAQYLLANKGVLAGTHGEAVEVRLIGRQMRTYSTLYRYEVRHAGTRRHLIVKMSVPLGVPDSDRAPGTGPDRPRIAPPAESATKYQLENDALSLIYQHFSSGDDRFSALRVFAALPHHRAVLMEAIDSPTLRHLALHAAWSRTTEQVLRDAFRNAGAWLQRFHQIEAEPARPVLQERRSHLICFHRQLTEFLAKVTGHVGYFSWLRDELAGRCSVLLSEFPPTGLLHGDFAMRNVFVTAGSRISVIDTLARHRAPVYRDIGFFLADLDHSSFAAIRHAAWSYPAHVRHYRDAFLGGYFCDDVVPARVLALFEITAHLERWSSVARDAAQRRTSRAGFSLWAMSKVFRALIRRRLEQSSADMEA